MNLYGLENSPLVELYNFDKNHLFFFVNGATNSLIKKLFNNQSRIKQVEISHNLDFDLKFEFAINNEQDNVVISWKPEPVQILKRKESFEFILKISFKILIDLPDVLILREKTHKKLKIIKDDLWAKALEMFPINN